MTYNKRYGILSCAAVIAAGTAAYAHLCKWPIDEVAIGEDMATVLIQRPPSRQLADDVAIELAGHILWRRFSHREPTFEEQTLARIRPMMSGLAEAAIRRLLQEASQRIEVKIKNNHVAMLELALLIEERKSLTGEEVRLSMNRHSGKHAKGLWDGVGALPRLNLAKHPGQVLCNPPYLSITEWTLPTWAKPDPEAKDLASS